MTIGYRSVEYRRVSIGCQSVEYLPSVDRVSFGRVLAEC